ncbi:MAG: LysM peptidoglycan-binding domain-containing protein [candidate division Zixibacteria bacterium]|nr:LysM peptidoglycan-binding domain-containing protein [candidate division Zixibacteria bacterium]
MLMLVSMVGCSSGRAGADPGRYGGETKRQSPTSTDTSQKTSATTDNEPADNSPVDDTLAADFEVAEFDESGDPVAPTNQSAESDGVSNYGPDSEQFWDAIQRAEEYYTMGTLANRESSWEEALYYFEKSLGILADLDFVTDEQLTPEAVKYSTLVDNVITDYRAALRSLGRLDDEAAPSAIIERFGDIEDRIKQDSMIVYQGETPAVKYDLPVVMNDRVKKSIVYFQRVADQAFHRYLTRSKKYDKLFKSILSEYGLPHDLVYLCLVESGYNPHAYSYARAMGLWQFIASTGKIYGLQRNWWIDERKDPVKATHAAARFLKDLYTKFGSWDLAMAAYNGGPGRVERTMKAQRTDDFWKLRLRQQTMDYVPLIFAATYIAKEPEKYGFVNIQFEPEIVWDEVKIDRPLELKTVAEALNCSVEEMKTLNPELLRSVTPPNTRDYSLKIPKGSRNKFLQAYESMESAKTATWARHKVKRKETLAKIANRYGVSQYAILEANNLSKGANLKSGTELIIPVPAGRTASRGNSSSGGVRREYQAANGMYSVRSGDTMWDIAKAFGCTTDELRRLNALGATSHLQIGQKLKLPSYVATDPEIESAAVSLPKPQKASKSASSTKSTNPKVYVVKRGDTISEVAKRFGTTTSKIRKMNSMGKSSRIYVGQQLRVAEGGASETEFIVYQVRRGDTLGRIAEKYKTSVSKIMADNNSIDPMSLQVGDRIKIYME